MTRRVSLSKSLAGFSLAALLFAVTPVKADSIVYVSPTSSIVALSDTYVYPTSSIVSTSYLAPTTYVSATSYVVPTTTVVTETSRVVPTTTVVRESSYLVPTTTVYVPRSYIRRTARYGTIVSPTYYIAPTTYLTPTYYLAPTRTLVETRSVSSICCDPDPCAESAAPVKSAPAPTATKAKTAQGGAAGADRVERAPSAELNEDPAATPTAAQRPKSLTSTPAGGDSGAVEPESTKPSAAIAPPQSQRQTSPPPSTPPSEPSPFESKPAPAAAQPPASKPAPRNDPPKPTEPAPKPAAAKPVAPAPGASDPDPGLDLPPIPPPIGAPDSNRRSSMRPKIDDSATEARLRRNVLQGRVLNAETGETEEGVTVILSDRLQRFVDRTIKTDALGRFAVSLPDGDWTVKVTMPSGRTYAVGNGDVTATSGRITDGDGRDVNLLTIRR